MSVRSLLFKSRAEREMDQELRFHIEMQTALNVRKGMTPEQAQRAPRPRRRRGRAPAVHPRPAPPHGLRARFTPRAHEIGIDGTVLLFTIGVALLTGLLAGMAPAFSRQDPTAMLKEGGGRGTSGGRSLRTRNLLIVFQFAASFMLLIGAGLTLRRFWGERSPLGQRISLDGGENWRTVVGMVGDVKQYGLDSKAADEIYRPFAQYAIGGGNLLVRSDLPPATIEKLVRDSMRAIDPEQPVDNVRTLEEARAESLAPSRLTTTLLGVFAILALVITAAGIAGILAFSVSQRTHEIGIRMALGAVPGDVRFMILRQAAMLVIPGLALGMAGALVLTRVLTSLLFGVEPTDPATFVAVSLLLLGVAAVACFVPARRATEIHPMVALRSM
ncbi:MAG TPA: FtsX-like permease family protein [Vicinamibacteria bacterium]